MKVKVLLSLVFISFLSLTISSYREGPAYWNGSDCTGATGSRVGCGGGGCHGSTASNNVVIELDSAGVPVNRYFPGMSYVVKISATNATGQTLPDFGFQICSGWPIPIVEHKAAIQATTGTGTNGTTYVESINWTAPAHGTGTVLLYGVLNAVNHDGQQSGDYGQAAIADTITEGVISHNGINAISSYLNGFTVYPTLMNDNVTVAFDLKQSSDIKIEMLSMQGAVVKTILPQQSIATGSFRQSYDVKELSSGIYLVRLQTGGASIVSKVVKE